MQIEVELDPPSRVRVDLDLVIQDQAAEIAALEELVARYRLLGSAAINELRARNLAFERLREQHRRVIAEYRALREREFKKVVAA